MRIASGLDGRERRALIAGITCCGSIMAVGRGLPALRAWEAAQRGAAATAREQLATLRGIVRATGSLRLDANRARIRIAELDSELVAASTPAEAGAALALLLGAMADSAGVQLGAETVRTDSVFVGGFARALVRVTATSDVRGLMRFLTDVEGGSVMLAVRELNVSQPDPAAGGDKPEALRFDAVVEALTRWDALSPGITR